MQRTNYCGLIDTQYVGKTVTVMGWVNRRRDLGGLIFIDLRDREGLVQIVAEPGSKCFSDADQLKHEYVAAITGLVRIRPNPNTEMKTGQIEIVAETIKILNSALTPPIIADDPNISETNRLQHRIIDLRSQRMQHNIKLRSNLTRTIRNFLDNNGFIDIETPYLTLSTPGGARDFLVPSRMHKGKFYALPQSPQIFKQLLMVSGFDRYYQVVRCFRDEELRADRQPEFTQIDIETTFLNGHEIRDIAENMMREVFKSVMQIDLPPLKIMTYGDAMALYGSDKPDLRIPLKFIDLTLDMQSSEFKVFNQAANLPNGRVVALKLPSRASLSRKEIDTYTEFVAGFGARGLAYIKVNDVSRLNEEGLQSPIVKFLSIAELQTIITKTGAQNGDTLLFAADSAKVVNSAMGALRLKLGRDKNLIESKWEALWVVDFPMFEYDEEKGSYTPCHHPFTAPHDEHLELLSTAPEKCLAKAYDMVLNGWEIGGGSERIYNKETQDKVFSAINLTPEEASAKFGFLLNNLEFGAPPHGGIAFGLDRVASILCNADSIRDVIAFPKTTTGQCLLTTAPDYVDDSQLAELGLKVIGK